MNLRRLEVTAAALLSMVAVTLAATAYTPAADAATTRTGGCAYFPGEGTEFHNYDYLGKEALCNEVDWATSMIFYGNATINKVKSALHNRGYSASSTGAMHMRVKSANSGLEWDSDGGKKGIACPAVGLETRHYRIYAPPSRDYMYSMSYGYWVVGSTHWDKNECPPIGKRHYGSEEVEKHIASTLERAGYFVTRDYRDLGNYEPYRVEGNHTWDNNGKATFIKIK